MFGVRRLRAYAPLGNDDAEKKKGMEEEEEAAPEETVVIKSTRSTNIHK